MLLFEHRVDRSELKVEFELPEKLMVDTFQGITILMPMTPPSFFLFENHGVRWFLRIKRGLWFGKAFYFPTFASRFGGRV
jgi:hypothetical protein